MSLKRILTKDVVTISAKATVQEAAMKMRDEHVGDVVIVQGPDGKGPPVGILTDRDIVITTTAFGIAPHTVSVEEIMVPTLVTAYTTDTFYHILNLMKEHGIKRIPIVTSVGELAGIVSSEDIIAILSSELGDIVKIKRRQHSIEAEFRKRIA